MRRGSTVAGAVVWGLVVATSASAHRRDEHLQAARIGIEPDHVTVDLDVTPGADLAGAAIAAIDRDGNGALSPAERDAYAGRVADALWLANDGHAHALRLISAVFPEPSAIRRGEGTIALRFRADLPALAAGAHELVFGNGHAPTQSVYLANALVPRSPRVSVRGQTRSPHQHELAIAYMLAPPGPSRLLRRAVVITAGAVLVLWPLGRHVLGRRQRAA
jgi:hypothetical protein